MEAFLKAGVGKLRLPGHDSKFVQNDEPSTFINTDVLETGANAESATTSDIRQRASTAVDDGILKDALCEPQVFGEKSQGRRTSKEHYQSQARVAAWMEFIRDHLRRHSSGDMESIMLSVRNENAEHGPLHAACYVHCLSGSDGMVKLADI